MSILRFAIGLKMSSTVIDTVYEVSFTI